jgi:hypothetical protein
LLVFLLSAVKMHDLGVCDKVLNECFRDVAKNNAILGRLGELGIVCDDSGAMGSQAVAELYIRMYQPVISRARE